MACKDLPLDWSNDHLFYLSEENIHIDKDAKKDEEEEEEEEQEEEEEDDNEEEEWGEDEWEDVEKDDQEDDVSDNGSISDLPSPKPSLPDVEGAIPKSALRKMANNTIRKVIVHVKKHILLLETENYLYEKTIEKLEASEKEIDSRIPANADEEFEKHLKRTQVMLCPSDAEDEEEPPPPDGNYQAISAVDEVHPSKDSFFENMSDVSKGTAMEFFRNVGEMAPPNYDVMHHKV